MTKLLLLTLLSLLAAVEPQQLLSPSQQTLYKLFRLPANIWPDLVYRTFETIVRSRVVCGALCAKSTGNRCIKTVFQLPRCMSPLTHRRCDGFVYDSAGKQCHYADFESGFGGGFVASPAADDENVYLAMS